MKIQFFTCTCCYMYIYKHSSTLIQTFDDQSIIPSCNQCNVNAQILRHFRRLKLVLGIFPSMYAMDLTNQWPKELANKPKCLKFPSIWLHQTKDSLTPHGL